MSARTKQSLLSEAEDIKKSINEVIDNWQFNHPMLETRVGQLERWVSALLRSRVDDLRERAAAIPDETDEGSGQNLADATKKDTP